jgi:hypothetical protein
MTFYKAQNGIIRIYLDYSNTPVIQGAPDQLLSGSILSGPPLAVSVQAGAPLGEEGRDYDHNLYVPVPFAKHCKVTYECDSLRILYDYEGKKVEEGYYWPDVFYNICYRVYSKNVKVESFSWRALRKAGPEIQKACNTLVNNKISYNNAVREYEKLINPGDSLYVEISCRDKAVNLLSVKIKAGNMPQALRSTVIKAAFDGHNTIWAPVGEFFGSGCSLGPHMTWMNSRDENGTMNSFWIMPFREKATFAIINYGSDPVTAYCSSELEPYKWTDRSMYFGTSWHEYYDIRTRDADNSPYDLNYIDVNGKGLYAGDQITIFNPDWHWWGEGDEKIFVDDESFPSSFGTGTEDYYGYSFGREEPFSHPFLSQPEGKGNMSGGLTVNMRQRSLDAIPFTGSISSNIELWHWADIRMNYALTSFYYIMIPYRSNILHDIESVKNPVGNIR